MSLSLRALRILCLLIAGSIWLGLTATAVVPPTSLELVQQFDQYVAYEYTKTLSTQFDGRRVGTPGGEAAAQFVAAAFQQMGLQPAGDNGTYFQNFDMPFLELAETPELVLFDERGAILRNFQHRMDFREFIVGTAGPGQANAAIVYVGSGSPDEFSSIDVAQKIALAIPKPGSDTVSIVTEAFHRGALGALLLATSDASAQIKPSYIINLEQEAIPTMRLTRATMNTLLEKSGETVDTVTHRQPYALDVRVHMSIALQPIHTVTVSNVLGLLPGVDPIFAHKVVIIGGHYDHVGRDPNGTVFPGANDNASGAAVTLAIAKLLTSHGFRPKASILFVGWGAEEAGLVGSDYYVHHARIPLDETIASLVLDVVGRGEGAQLEAEGDPNWLLDEVRASASALGLTANTQNGGGGSDHGPFLESNVPAALFIWQNSVQTIHRPDDTIYKIDPAKLRVTGMIVALTALTLAGVDP